MANNQQYQISCPFCNIVRTVPATYLGIRVKCADCGHEYDIAEGSDPVTAPPIVGRPDGIGNQISSLVKVNTVSTKWGRERRPRSTRSQNFVWAVVGIYVFFFIATGLVVLTDPEMADALVLGPVMLTGLTLLYVIPTLVSYVRDHQNLMPIFIVNMFFGWTLLGWVIVMAWAFSSNVRESRQVIRHIITHDER